MAHKFHMPIQRNILAWLLMPNYGGKNISRKKRDELNIKFRKMYWLLGCNSELSIHNKLTLYKQIIRPVWSYGIQLWGCASDSNIQVIQRYCVLPTHHGTFVTVTFIVTSGSRRLQISSLRSQTLMKRDSKTTSTSKCPDFSMPIISPDDSNGRSRSN
jgi:hypothetical protein